MFIIDKKKIEMIEGDFGIDLPITIELEDEEVIGENDKFKVSIYKGINGELIVEKNYSVDDKNTFNLNLTEIESMKLKVGYYKYDLDWYCGNVFMNNIIAKENFVVKEKAGIINES